MGVDMLFPGCIGVVVEYLDDLIRINLDSLSQSWSSCSEGTITVTDMSS